MILILQQNACSFRFTPNTADSFSASQKQGSDRRFTLLSFNWQGRNYEEIRQQHQHITVGLNANIKVLDMPLVIRELQRHGIEIKRAEGRNHGRKPKEIDEELFRHECAKWRSGEQTAVETMKRCGVIKTLFYRKVRELGV